MGSVRFIGPHLSNTEYISTSQCEFMRHSFVNYQHMHRSASWHIASMLTTWDCLVWFTPSRVRNFCKYLLTMLRVWGETPVGRKHNGIEYLEWEVLWHRKEKQSQSSNLIEILLEAFSGFRAVHPFFTRLWAPRTNELVFLTNGALGDGIRSAPNILSSDASLISSPALRQLKIWYASPFAKKLWPIALVFNPFHSLVHHTSESNWFVWDICDCM